MATLHIEHVRDLATWLGAFNRFAEARVGAGVRQTRVHQPIDDEHYIYGQLDFDDVAAAIAFSAFSRTCCGHRLTPHQVFRGRRPWSPRTARPPSTVFSRT